MIKSKLDEDRAKYITALKKRALGYEYEEVTTIVEDTPLGIKKKIQKTKKHIPADIETAKWFLRKLEKTEKIDNVGSFNFDEIEKEINEDIKNGN